MRAKDNPLVNRSEALQRPPVSSPVALCPTCLEVVCECNPVAQCAFVGHEYDFRWQCDEPAWRHGVCKWHFLEEDHDRVDCKARRCKEIEVEKQFVLGERVLIECLDEPGVVVEVNDPDQGDFEYMVVSERGGTSFWPRESLRRIS